MTDYEFCMLPHAQGCDPSVSPCCCHLKDVGRTTMSLFADEVQDELNRARAKHPTPMHSKHEGFAILLEEVDEVKQEVFHGKSRQLLREELIQVAAMAQRMAEDCKL